MRKLFKILGKIAGILAGLYALLFAVFYFDLDGKLLYYVVEPFLCRHYDKTDPPGNSRRVSFLTPQKREKLRELLPL